MNFLQILVLIVYALSLMLLLSLIVLLMAGARTKSKQFIILVTTLLAWLLPQFVAQYLVTSESLAVQLLRISILLSGLVPFALAGFVKEQLKISRERMLDFLGVASVSLGLICAIFQPSTINIEISKAGIAVTSTAPFYYLLLASVFGSFLLAILKIRKEEHRQQKKQIAHNPLRILRQALTLALVLNLVGAVFLAQYEWSQILTPISMALMSAIIYVAIFKHKLFDIRAFVSRFLGYLFSLSVIAAIYGTIVFLSADLFFDLNLDLGEKMFFVGATIVTGLLYQPFRTVFARTTNKFFFQDAYEPQELFDHLNKVLVSSIDIKYLMNESISILENALKPDFTVVTLREGELRQRMFVSRKIDLTQADVAKIRKLTANVHRKVIVADYLEAEKHRELQNLLLKNDIAVLVRLAQNVRITDEGLGYLAFGTKKSGNPYTQQDIRVLDTVANELIIAVQNALHYEEIQKFNLVLQAKVDDATRKMRNTNEKLRALDETKDDFISMASHQLRTPLTSVKGYLSMVLEGDAGKINATQKKMLGQAYVSSQRMVYLIADLLNVSRLKTGKFEIQAAPTNLAQMVSEEIDQLVETASAREIELSYDQPSEFPDLMLDETKTRQVIMNFVDNAIYYTKSGGHIRVELSDTPTSVELKVIDDGIGVPKTEQPHLFTKFYRAGNARKARPDGTGLGLYMAKKVVLAQGGSIIFESKEGKGSSFGFLFPKSLTKHVAKLPVVDNAAEAISK